MPLGFLAAGQGIGDAGFIASPTGVRDTAFFAETQTMGVAVYGFLAALTTLSADPSGGFLAGIQTLDAVDFSAGFLLVSNQIEDLVTRRPDVTRDIYLDGRRINAMVTKMTLTDAESAWHNTVVLTSTSRALFDLSDPNVLRGAARIEVHITENSVTRVRNYLLEERSGTKISFSLWGRDITAADAAPYAGDVMVSLTEPQLASNIAADMLTQTPLSWEAADFVVHEFDYVGPPIAGIAELATQIRAVIRPSDDGTLIVRPYRRCRPVDLPAQTADFSFTGADTIVSSWKINRGTGINRIRVQGRHPGRILPDLVLEESPPIRGEDVHVRAYWPGDTPSIVETVVTAGRIQLLGLETESMEAVLVFEDGQSTSQYPIKAVDDWQWYGSAGGTISAVAYEKTFTASGGGDGVAMVTYTTEYQRYRIYDHNIAALLSVFIFSDAESVDVLVESADETVVDGGLVSAPMLSAPALAFARGIAEIDAVRYDVHEATFSTPYTSAARAGAVTDINNAAIGPSGNYYVTSVISVFGQARTTNQITVEKCLL